MIVGLSAWKFAKVAAIASVGYVIKAAQDVVAASQGTSIDWTPIFLAFIGLLGIVFSGVMSYLAAARTKAAVAIATDIKTTATEIKHEVNSSAASLKTVADREKEDSKRKDDKILTLTVSEAAVVAELDALKRTYAAAQERLVTLAVQIPTERERAPAAAPAPNAAPAAAPVVQIPSEVKIVMGEGEAVPVEVKEGAIPKPKDEGEGPE